MFILVSAFNAIISHDNTVSVYATEEQAHQAMVDEIRQEVLGDDPEATFREDNDGVVYGDYQVEARNGYVGACNGREWIIYEV